MFTGIVECMATVVAIEKEGSNMHLLLRSSITPELKIDQSISHNGVCLTVVRIDKDIYKVTAVEETLKKTNLRFLKAGDAVNLERSMLMNGRIDGHIVQGHVDETCICTSVEDRNGSWLFHFENDGSSKSLTVEKGSVCVNGVSLTVVDSGENNFSVAIIPYTFEHTNFNSIKTGSVVNVEYDILGKYVLKYLSSVK